VSITADVSSIPTPDAALIQRVYAPQFRAATALLETIEG
jgi:hypothetical protein